MKLFIGSFVLSTTLVHGAIYQKVGTGMCRGDSSTTYNHISKSGVSGSNECSDQCERVNHIEKDRSHYRGFSFVRPNGEQNEQYTARDCYCFYDSSYVPTEEWESKSWKLYANGDADGPIAGSDGTEPVDCYREVF